MRSYVRLNFPANSPDFPTIPPGLSSSVQMRMRRAGCKAVLKLFYKLKLS